MGRKSKHDAPDETSVLGRRAMAIEGDIDRAIKRHDPESLALSVTVAGLKAELWEIKRRLCRIKGDLVGELRCDERAQDAEMRKSAAITAQGRAAEVEAIEVIRRAAAAFSEDGAAVIALDTVPTDSPGGVH
jgi:hypothetical protein